MTAFEDPSFWDALADDYAAKPFPAPEATARKLALIRSRLQPGDHLLDVGCGTGTLTLDLGADLAEAHGVDLSSRMIEIATHKAEACGADHVHFHAAPAGDLSAFESGSFQVALAFNLLHLVEDPEAQLRELARVLAPGALLATHTACLGGRWFPPYALLLPVMRLLGKAPPVTLLRAEELEAMVVAAGFEAVETPDVGAESHELFLLARRA